MQLSRAGKIAVGTIFATIALAYIIWGWLLVFPVHAAAPTKTETTEALGWTLLTDTGDTSGIKETGSIDVSASYATTLHIDVCGASAAAHEGTEVIVQIASEAAEDGSWSTLTRYIALGGITIIKADITGANTGTSVPTTNPETAGLDHDGKEIIIYDVATIANSQIMYQVDNSGDAGDTVTTLDAPDHATDSDCDMLGVDTFGGTYTAVSAVAVNVPLSASQARVIINNFYDNDGTAADVIARVRVTVMTAAPG